MYARRSLEDDEDYRSLDRDEDYQDDDRYNYEIMRELNDEDRGNRDDDSQDEEKSQDEDDIDGIVIICKYFQTTNSSLRKIIARSHLFFVKV